MMDMQMETWVDKTSWGDGPWQQEPDRAEWRDDATGLACLARRSPGGGNWCGYVAVPPGHAWHGKDYDDIEDEVDVHGGLTFCGPCMPHVCTGGEQELREVVCHTPQAGEPDDVWWLGFDCHHFRDIAPAFQARMRELDIEIPGTAGFAHETYGESYKPLAYVRSECAHLAAQAADAVSPES